MATDIFEDFGEKSQSLWDRLAMRDFEEVQSAFRNTQRSSPYVSPLYERNKPKDGSLLKLDQPLSFFSGDTNENSNFSYTYRVILCDNGSQVLDTYQKTATNANEMVIICEKDDPNKSNLFGTFLLIKFGEKYRSMVNDLRNNVKRVIVSRKGQINGVEIDSFSDEVTDNHSILQKNGVTIERDKVEFAMNTELNITSSEGILLKTIFGGLEELIDWVTIGLSDQLEKIKFTEKDYVPQKKQEGLSFIEYLELLVELEVEAIKKVIDYAIPDEVEKVIAQSFDAALTNIKQYAKEKLPKGVLRLFEKAYATIQECLNFFKEGCKKLAELVGEALLLFKALLMGFVNGLISTIQMLLQLIGWLIKFTSGINSYKKLTGESYRDMQSKFEFVEDIIDLISDKASDFFTAVKTLFLDFSLENMKEILKVFTGKASNLTPYHYAYYAGCFIFEVVLAVVLAIFTGGATAIAEAASMFEKVMATLKLVAKEAFSVATMGIIDVLQLFRVLITKFVQACKKGWVGFRDFLKKITANETDDIAREEGKIFDEPIGGKGPIGVGEIIGKYSKRAFNPKNAGGEILNLVWKDAKITKDGIGIVKKHLSRFDDVPANKKMIERLEKIEAGKLEITDWDKKFYTHETREFERYKNLGYENAKNSDIPSNVWNDTHAATLEDYKLSEYDEFGNDNIYHPDIKPEDFYTQAERDLLGI